MYLRILFYFSISIIILLFSCKGNDLIKDSKWKSNRSETLLKIDSNLEATIKNKIGFDSKYSLQKITNDSLIFDSKYKDSKMTGGFFKLINSNEILFCNFKLHPNRSGNIDYYSLFTRENKIISLANNTSTFEFPRKSGRYVLEYLNHEIDYITIQDEHFIFENNHLKLNSKLKPLELTKNNYDYRFVNSNDKIPTYNEQINYDSVLTTNPDSIFVYYLGLNAFSHYKIYQYDSIIVKNEAEYFYVGEIHKIVNQKIYGN